MSLRSLAATAACICVLVTAQFSPAIADGMPDDEDDNFNPVPSVPAVPAPGMKQPPPVRSNGKPIAPTPPAPPAQPVSPKVEPAPAPLAAPIAPPEPAPVVAPQAAPTAPVTTRSPVVVQPVTPVPTTDSSAVTPPAAAPKPAAKAAPQPTVGQATIYEVLTIDIAILKKNPAAAQVTVKGTARTGGWSKIELKPLQSVSPETGMRSFTLVGQPPSGFATQVLTPVSATFTIDPLPDDVKTIRVLSETNEIAQTFR